MDKEYGENDELYVYIVLVDEGDGIECSGVFDDKKDAWDFAFDVGGAVIEGNYYDSDKY